MKVFYIFFILKGMFSKVVSITLPLRFSYHLCATESTVLHWFLLSLLNFSPVRGILRKHYRCVFSALKEYLFIWKYWRKEVMGYCQHLYKQDSSPPEELNKNSIDRRWKQKLHLTPFDEFYQFVVGGWQT